LQAQQVMITDYLGLATTLGPPSFRLLTYVTNIVYYIVNVGMLVNRRLELKKQGKLHEELVSVLPNNLERDRKSEKTALLTVYV
jgi:hypothetical protein